MKLNFKNEKRQGRTMKLGFVSAILDDMGYEEMIDTAAELGFECVETACWPQGKAERRYAGVSHINVERVLEEDVYAEHILNYASQKEVEISSLAYYPNTMDGDIEKRNAAVEHLKNVIRASGYLGINYDPSHFVWQMIDYIQPIYEFKDKIFHVHYKDIKLYPERLNEVGIMAYPLEFMSPKLPGLGDVDWGRYVSALTDIHYDGYTCIEVEDKAFEGSREAVIKSLKLSKTYMSQFVI